MTTKATTSDYPEFDDLPAVNELPDPFTFMDGSRVTLPDDWGWRRAELKEQILHYQYGMIPSERIDVAHVTSTRAINGDGGAGAVRVTELLLKLGPGRGVLVRARLHKPAGREGPLPVIVRGDLCWGPLAPAIVREATRRGYAVCDFDRTEVAPDGPDRSVGAYPLYTHAFDWRALSAWAWGFHRVVDYLLTRPDIDPARIIATGHSRGGKAALLAGATDERIALTAPNNSGCGGAGCYRVQPPGSEDIAAILKNFPFWFAPRFAQFVGHVDRLPFDQHSLKALVAPRALLSTEALGDLWASPEGTQHTHLAAREVFDFLGAADRIGIHFREGGHDHGPADWSVLMDFADRTLMGKPVDRSFDRLAFPTDPTSYSWRAPPPLS